MKKPLFISILIFFSKFSPYVGAVWALSSFIFFDPRSNLQQSVVFYFIMFGAIFGGLLIITHFLWSIYFYTNKKHLQAHGKEAPGILRKIKIITGSTASGTLPCLVNYTVETKDQLLEVIDFDWSMPIVNKYQQDEEVKVIYDPQKPWKAIIKKAVAPSS